MIYLFALGHIKIVELLIEKGANISLGNVDGFPPLHYAARHGNICSVDNQHFHKKLLFGFCLGHEKIIELLLQNGASINAVDNYKWNALHWAIEEAGEFIILIN